MDKWLCVGSMVVGAVILLLYALDLVLGLPFDHAGGGWRGYTQDLFFVVAAGLLLWQGYETYRELS